MFDLEKEISEWRRRLDDAGIKSPGVLNELENHLREEIARLKQTGMDAKTSWKTAMEKIGAANDLQAEFAKVEKVARASKQMKLMPMASLVTIAVWAAAFGALLYFRMGNFSEMNSAQRNSGYGALGLMLLFGFGGRFGYRVFPRIDRKKIRDAICISAGLALAVWWTVLFWGILQWHEYTMAELLVVIVWSFIMPFGLIVGLCVGIETAARKKSFAAAS
ncbi:MAG TPA: hypothetical protein VFB72_01665 [Verrucomicrobiae bacterium]|nr:hypothetical protein [Verrucomicrobiae bacterium]